MTMLFYIDIEERIQEVEEATRKHGEDWWLHVRSTVLSWWLSRHPNDLVNVKVDKFYEHMREGYRECGLVR